MKSYCIQSPHIIGNKAFFKRGPRALWYLLWRLPFLYFFNRDQYYAFMSFLLHWPKADKCCKCGKAFSFEVVMPTAPGGNDECEECFISSHTEKE